MPTFVFNDDLATRIAQAISTTPKTARQIAKELNEDKHIINQHLYFMRDLNRTAERIPKWSLPESDDDEPVPDDE
jgi:hypothetical protein